LAIQLCAAYCPSRLPYHVLLRRSRHLALGVQDIRSLEQVQVRPRLAGEAVRSHAPRNFESPNQIVDDDLEQLVTTGERPVTPDPTLVGQQATIPKKGFVTFKGEVHGGVVAHSQAGKAPEVSPLVL